MAQNKTFYDKPVGRKKAEMIKFLTNHFRYYTANSWNRNTSYANKVKIYDLGLTKELTDKALDFINADCMDYELDVHDLILDFAKRTGYNAGFNGRSYGYIVLYETQTVNGETRTMIRSIDQNEDFENWTAQELAERVKLVHEFDKLCDNIRSTFIYYLENTNIREESYTVVKKHNVARLKSDQEQACTAKQSN